MAEEEHVCGLCKLATVLEVTTQCHHHFCGKCIVRWMVHNYFVHSDTFPCPMCQAKVLQLEYAANEVEGQEGQMLARLTNLFSDLHSFETISSLSWSVSYREARRIMIGTIRAFMADEGEDFFNMLDRIKWRDIADIDDIAFLRRYLALVVVIWVIAIGFVTAAYLMR